MNGSTPYTQEAEEAVIGAVLINPSIFVTIAAFLKPEDFFIVRHGYIWDALRMMDEQNAPVDYFTVNEQLRTMGRLEEVGGPAYVTGLINNTPTSIHAEFYGRLVERAALRRRLFAAADVIKALAIDETRSTEEVTDEAEQRLFDISNRRASAEFVPLFEVANRHADKVEAIYNAPRDIIGLPTGFKYLDKLTRGFQERKLYIIAARPGMGKSALLQHAALYNAEEGKRTALFSLEMGDLEVVDRLASIKAQLDSTKLMSGDMTAAEFSRYMDAIGQLSKLPIWITENGDITPMGIRSACRRLKKEQGLDAVFIDYVQLINPGGGKFGSREQEVSYISRSLKMLSKELDVPVIIAAQLSRAVETRTEKRPQLSDLRESGGLEADADCVLFLYSDNYYDIAPQADPVWSTEIQVAKHRGGPLGRVTLGFRREFTQFVELAEDKS